MKAFCQWLKRLWQTYHFCGMHADPLGQYDLGKHTGRRFWRLYRCRVCQKEWYGA